MAMTFQQQLEEALKRQQPAFRPTYEGLLSQPQAEVKPYSQDTFEPLLGKPSTAVQLGLLGGSFLPGAGMADYMGYYPSAQGGYEPSAAKNIQQGNYLTAGLQGLGAMGDAAMAIPLLGAIVGSAAKAPRAIQRGVSDLAQRVMPKIDELGFFSQVEKSVMDIPQQKGTGQQFLAQIQKTPGVKPEELQYTGLDQFLANKPTVTKGEIQDYLDANRVQVQEVQLGDVPFSEINFNERFSGAGYWMEQTPEGPIFYRDGNQIDYSQVPERMQATLENEKISNTKFSQYTLPGGENYREVLLTLPAKQRPNQFTLRNNESGGTVGNFDTMEEAQEFMRTTPREDIRGGNWSVQETTSGTEPVYRSSHFDQPNILAHMRVNDRTIDGKPTLFIEEVQSDWHQAGRKQGYATGETKRLSGTVEQQSPNEFQVTWEDGTFSGGYGSREAAEEVAARGKSNAKVGVPDAPFKSTWDELTLKRAIKMASDEGYDQIAFTTGKTQAERYALSRSVDSIDVRGIGDNRRIVQINGKEGRPFQLQVNDDGIVEASMYARQFEGKPLDEVVGKDVAKQLMETTEAKSLTGLDLDVGGEGMKGFYDKMLPKKLEKLGKKYGAKPVKSTMQTPDGEVEVWTFNIPKEMRETVKEQGQPLFQIGAGVGLGTAGLLATEEEQY